MRVYCGFFRAAVFRADRNKLDPLLKIGVLGVIASFRCARD